MSRPTLRSQLFTFRGRTNRAKYWMTALIALAIYVVGGSALWVLRAGTQGMIALNGPLLIALGVGGLGAYVLGSVIGIFAAIRRLHDRDKSGHWLWLFYFVPSVLNVVVQLMMPPGANPQAVNPVVLVPMLVSLVLIIWGVVQLGFLRGTPGANRFGADPLQA